MSDPVNMDSPEQTQGLGEKFATLRAEHPEVIVAAAFVGGVVLAVILKRMAGH